ncbi:MAG: FAD:protein FMN transferase [Propionibacteriaceae bacterium]|nr:FAD:protein FMN transferase [Propionibacteriaceae bacterium]
MSTPRRWVIESMNTVFSLVVAGVTPDVDDVVAAIEDDFVTIESRLSVFRPDSEISQWRDGRLPDAQLSADLREVIEACDQAEAITGGLFSARRAGGYDPTGYVKGWALARAARRLDGAGLDYCLNGGGDIIARGVNPEGAAWRLGIAHPYRPGELATIVSMTTTPSLRATPPEEGNGGPIAVATSGTGERGSHIVNPLDGWRPVNSSVTVVGHDIALVDMAATAALAAGRDGPRDCAALVQRLGLEAFGFDEDRHPWWTDGMPKYALLPQTK